MTRDESLKGALRPAKLVIAMLPSLLVLGSASRVMAACGDGGTTCRAAAGLCDIVETCNGDARGAARHHRQRRHDHGRRVPSRRRAVEGQNGRAWTYRDRQSSVDGISKASIKSPSPRELKLVIVGKNGSYLPPAGSPVTATWSSIRPSQPPDSAARRRSSAHRSGLPPPVRRRQAALQVGTAGGARPWSRSAVGALTRPGRRGGARGRGRAA